MKRRKSPTEPKSYILNEDTPWNLKEAYKSLRTNVLLSTPDDGNRVIAFTSAEPHDGKTTNAVNFAISLSQIDKKVLLIDCDLRKPMVANLLNINQEPGLTELITKQARAQEAMKRLTTYGIDVLPSGTIPPDPTLLLQSERMKAIISEMKKIYDFIVFDLPPVNMVADASIIAELIDGFLLVVRHDETDYRSVANMMEQLELANAKILGFVYNGQGSDSKHYYKYNYSYKYGNSYYRQD